MDFKELQEEFEKKRTGLKKEIAEHGLRIQRLRGEQETGKKEIEGLKARRVILGDEVEGLKAKREFAENNQIKCRKENSIVTDELSRLDARKKRLSSIASIVTDGECGLEDVLEPEATMEETYPMLWDGSELRSEDFPPAVWIPGFISITGSAIYGNDREPNDIDVVVRAKETGGGGFSIELDPALNLKINRVLNKRFPEKEIHWSTSPYGPNWRHCEVWDLVLVPREKLELTEMNEPEFAEKFYDAAKKVTLFTFFLMLKPMAGRYKEEEYSIDSVIHVIESRPVDWFKDKIATQVKYDGVHSQIHKDKSGRVLILTEEGTDITAKLPSLVDEIKSINGSFILAAELEIWREGKHAARQEMAALIHKKKYDEDEKLVRANIFDCLYFEVGK